MGVVGAKVYISYIDLGWCGLTLGTLGSRPVAGISALYYDPCCRRYSSSFCCLAVVVMVIAIHCYYDCDHDYYRYRDCYC